jgi:hypothetical protein
LHAPLCTSNRLFLKINLPKFISLLVLLCQAIYMNYTSSDKNVNFAKLKSKNKARFRKEKIKGML